ncbi:poly(A) polymerase type 3-like [Cheilinus undulatus]|uniref:poly(A) polymerase type 3-like n=1 Tax=Cheilinus undulatus TaxID=241271 RepID=UPI001BD6BF9F|nr:poly(A) polymerase type 3-like [Cheilinus undulatus]
MSFWRNFNKEREAAVGCSNYDCAPPVSEAFPEEKDLDRTKSLLEELRSCGIFEDSGELQHRENVVKKLESLYKEWLKETCVSMDVPEVVTDKVGGKIFPFGSYHLGADFKGADIDILCVGPGFVERKEFFTSFYNKLKAQKEVKDLLAIEEAFVPVIKLTYDGIEMDLVYARVNLRSVPEKISLLDDSLLTNLKPECVRSLNGYRVTEEIRRSVPNVSTFQLALRAIKLWAKRRRIYSNKLGFLGGVSWAIMVASICKMYPNASASTVVHKFFQDFSVWTWPRPVLLRTLVYHDKSFAVWNPLDNKADRAHLMPIITPAYPQQNSAFNVSRSTLAIIKEELQRGYAITEDIQEGKEKWAKLFQTSKFTNQYQHYIKLQLTSPTEEKHPEWVGLLESKIRHLVKTLERIEYISRAHVNTESLTAPPTRDGKITTSWLIGLLLDPKVYRPRVFNLYPELKPFRCHVYNLSETTNMTENGVTLWSRYILKENQTWRDPHPGNRVFRPVAPTVRPQTPSAAPCGAVRPAMTGKGWPKPLALKRNQSSVPSTSGPSASASVGPQGTKRPSHPQLETSAKRMRSEGQPTCPVSSPAAEPGSSGPSQSTKRACSSEPETQSKKLKPDLKTPAFTSQTVPADELCDQPSGLSTPAAPVKHNITFKLMRRF